MHITVESKLTFNDYLKLMYVLTYRKSLIVIITTVGVLSLIMSLLYFGGVKMPYDGPPYSQLVFGILIVFLFPASVYVSAKKMFASSARLQEHITYEFTEDLIRVTGESFKSEMNWEKIYKIVELKSWFLIYQNKSVANLISKTTLGDQQGAFKKLIQSKLNVKQKLRA